MHIYIPVTFCLYVCLSRDIFAEYLSYCRNIGKLYIIGKVVGQTLARMYVGRISTDSGAPSGENLHFSKSDVSGAPAAKIGYILKNKRFRREGRHRLSKCLPIFV